MSKQQTAVEYLIEQLLPKALSQEQYYHIEKAKRKECEQIAKAWERRAMDVTGYDYYRLYHGKLPIGGDHE
jgi:hypothetical protein